jgi:hypothetical protein
MKKCPCGKDMKDCDMAKDLGLEGYHPLLVALGILTIEALASSVAMLATLVGVEKTLSIIYKLVDLVNRDRNELEAIRDKTRMAKNDPDAYEAIIKTEANNLKDSDQVKRMFYGSRGEA